MESKEKEIKYSSQVILRDREGNFYLERNSHLWSISFWWGEKESTDKDEFDTALRELKEELGISFQRKDLEIIDIDGPHEFPKGIFISTLFLININQQIAKEVKRNSKTIIFTIEQIKMSDDSFVLWKKHFLRRISKILETDFWN